MKSVVMKYRKNGQGELENLRKLKLHGNIVQSIAKEDKPTNTFLI